MPNLPFLIAADFIEVLKKKHASNSYKKMVRRFTPPFSMMLVIVQDRWIKACMIVWAGYLCGSVREWEHIWRFNAGGPWHICDHSIQCRGEQLGNILPGNATRSAAWIPDLPWRPIQYCLDGGQVSFLPLLFLLLEFSDQLFFTRIIGLIIGDILRVLLLMHYVKQLVLALIELECLLT